MSELQHSSIEPRFAGLRQVIQEGISRRLHTGVQVCVLFRGQPILNGGLGLAADDQPIRPTTLMLWRSAGKPLTAALALQCVERGLFSLDTPLHDLLPEFRVTSDRRVTIRGLLTHCSGLAGLETGWPHLSWEDSIHELCRGSTTAEPGDAAYDPQANWMLLGECIRRAIDPDAAFAGVLAAELLRPAGLSDTHCGIPPEISRPRSADLPVIYERVAGVLRPSVLSGGEWLSRPSPGGNLRGPVSDLAAFYEMLRRSGQSVNGVAILSPESVHLMTERHRHNQYDATLQHKVDFGLGVMVDSSHHGSDTVPYGFGRGCSVRTFGHGGAQCAMGFCDPDHELVVCWSANGLCGEGHHQRRNAAINTAIYQDLGLI